jgi:hypothetical protein
MSNGAATFLRLLNGFEVGPVEILAFINEQPRTPAGSSDFGEMTLTKLSFRPLADSRPKRETAVALRGLALLHMVSRFPNLVRIVPPVAGDWREGPVFRVASMLPLEVFPDGSFGFDHSSFGAKLAEMTSRDSPRNSR